MKKTIGVILLLGVAGLLAAVSVAHSASSDGTLQANVGPGFSISLSQNGTRVTRLDPGTYTIAVNDQSSEHDFHLTGPGVDETTDIGGTGQTAWTVTFQNGTYTYVCDAHATTMRGTFNVGAAAPAPAPLSLRIVSAKVAKPRTVRVAFTASRSVAVTVSLWRGSARLAQARATAARATVSLVAKKPLVKGSYTVKLASGSASATKAVAVR